MNLSDLKRSSGIFFKLKNRADSAAAYETRNSVKVFLSPRSSESRRKLIFEAPSITDLMAEFPGHEFVPLTMDAMWKCFGSEVYTEILKPGLFAHLAFEPYTDSVAQILCLDQISGKLIVKFIPKRVIKGQYMQELFSQAKMEQIGMNVEDSSFTFAIDGKKCTVKCKSLNGNFYSNSFQYQFVDLTSISADFTPVDFSTVTIFKKAVSAVERGITGFQENSNSVYNEMKSRNLKIGAIVSDINDHGVLYQVRSLVSDTVELIPMPFSIEIKKGLCDEVSKLSAAEIEAVKSFKFECFDCKEGDLLLLDNGKCGIVLSTCLDQISMKMEDSHQITVLGVDVSRRVNNEENEILTDSTLSTIQKGMKVMSPSREEAEVLWLYHRMLFCRTYHEYKVFKPSSCTIVTNP